jgi:hypothetical protein
LTFLLFVEGKTEKKALSEFLRRWINTRLSTKVAIRCVDLKGWPNFRKEGRSGIAAVLDAPEHEDVIAGIGLLDLYGPDFPARMPSGDQRYRWGVEQFQREVNHPKFRMFFAVHETEAWLLSQTDVFPAGIRERLKKHEKRPETVNSTKPPSKRIAEAYQSKQWTYRKAIDGPGLFSKADPEKAYAACPHLRQMLDTMLDLAKQAGL